MLTVHMSFDRHIGLRLPPFDRVVLLAPDQRLVPTAIRIVDRVNQLRYVSLRRRVQLVGDGQRRWIGDDFIIFVQRQYRCGLRWRRQAGDGRRLSLP